MLLNVQNEQVYGAGMRTFLIRQEGAHGSRANLSLASLARSSAQSADTVSKFSLSFLSFFFFSPLPYSPGQPWGIPRQGNLLPKVPPSAVNPLAMTLLPS